MNKDLTEPSLPKSIFRGIPAGIATICNEQHPNSVSPYDGQGELAIVENPQKVIKVAFINTSLEQKLDVLPII